jgi:hypothetical protein
MRGMTAAGVLVFMATTGPSHGALIELSYRLTGEVVASWGFIGEVTPGTDETLSFSRSNVSGMDMSGVLRWRNDLDNPGHTFLLRLEQFVMTSDGNQNVTAPLALTITEDFIAPEGLSVVDDVVQEISGQAMFTRSQQRAIVSQRSIHEQLAPIDSVIDVTSPPLTRSLRSSAALDGPFGFDGVYRMQTRFGFTLWSEGQEFSISISNGQTYAVIVPAPGGVAVLSAGVAALHLGRVRRGAHISR